jgi:predicted Zn-dependent protease
MVGKIDPCGRRRVSIAALALAHAFVVLAGCDSAPRAPLLRDEAVYYNRREGFRFLVPEGWKIQAKAELPPGKLEQERMLVEYIRPTFVPATLQLSAADLGPNEDLGKYFETHNFRKREYRTHAVEKGVTIGRETIDRFSFPNSEDGFDKEITPIRRGERVFLFTALFMKEDHQGRDAVRQAVASLVWDK